MEKTLAIMAAGMGSRYGGLKQLDAIDEEGQSIIDFSIYDAVKAGFNHIVFIIRKELHETFSERFSHLQSNSISVSFVYQVISDIPEEFSNISRNKPWGTGHALLSLRYTIKNSFALINADDFYGKESFQVLHDSLYNSMQDDTYFMVGFKLKNTLSHFGSVSRGECYINKDKLLEKIIERTKVEKKGLDIKYIDDNNSSITLNENTIISMNFWGFTPSIFEYGESMFEKFLADNHSKPNSEFYIPTIVNELIEDNTVSVKVLNTDSVWHGITYKNDKVHVQNAIANMKAAKIYPQKLWV